MGIINKIIGFFKSIKGISNYTKRDRNKGGKTLEEFAAFVKEQFGSEYTIVENLPATTINPNVVDSRPYNLAFVKDERLVLTILFTEHNRDKNKYFINAKKTAKEYGVTCLNFYAHFPNDDDYVINRIRENL